MKQACNHELYPIREETGETWFDNDHYPHTVIRRKCLGCGRTVSVYITGNDIPHTYMPYYGPIVPVRK